MNIEIVKAEKQDLPHTLSLYADEDIDKRNVLPVRKAEEIFNDAIVSQL